MDKMNKVKIRFSGINKNLYTANNEKVVFLYTKMSVFVRQILCDYY